MAGFNIQLYGRNTCSVLTTVMLFFHEQVELIQAIQCRTIFLEIKGERFAKSDECQSAFMFYFVAQFFLFSEGTIGATKTKVKRKVNSF